MLRCKRLFEAPLSEHYEFDISRDSLTTTVFAGMLDKDKAVLIRGAESELSVQDFGDFVSKSLSLVYYPYIGGAAPRRVIMEDDKGEAIVFTANESPPHMPIPFHHELAQTKDPPQYIFFYCDQAAESGGETPIIDSTKVYRYTNSTHPEFMKHLICHGAKYTRVLTPEDDLASPIGRSWKNTYNVSSKEELDTFLKVSRPGDVYEWLDGDCVKITSEATPAVRLISEENGNFVYQYAFHNSIIAAFLGWQDSRNDRFQAVRFGDDSPMPVAVLDDIATFMEKNKISHVWRKGDILALNNRLVMHSRNTFTGPRRIYASIWGGLRNPDQSAGALNQVVISSEPEPQDPLVFGFWKVPDGEKTAYEAILNGYRRLDCASDYGNEVQVGKGIARALAEGVCRREDLYITSKLWNTFHNPAHVEEAFNRSLNDLGLSYLNEYLIHFPISMEYVPMDKKYPPEWTNLDGKMVLVPTDLNATWSSMEKLVDTGKCRKIGLSNFSTQMIRQILSKSRIPPKVLQVELHLENSQERLVKFARMSGLRVTGFSCLGAPSYVELGGATVHDDIGLHPLLVRLTEKYGKSAAQIMLRWALQRNTLPITKSSNPSRMVSNRELFDFFIDTGDMQALNMLNRNRRFNDPGAFTMQWGCFCPIYE
jgi:D-xylose reductase